MSLQGLGRRKVARIAEALGEPVVRATVNNAAEWHWWLFTTASHRHGAYNRYTGEIEWWPRGYGCTTLCRELFPGDVTVMDRLRTLYYRMLDLYYCTR